MSPNLQHFHVLDGGCYLSKVIFHVYLGSFTKISCSQFSSKSWLQEALEPAFQRDGQRIGTEIWRIENFQPIPLRKSDHCKFYLGDSYIVLQVHMASNISSFVSYFGPHFYELSVYD
ncbi:unnamed protein product [Coffea canephora]|uniref:DH200=94 genomic scaffold, scaffold_1513 n=1 Tax=Coffea canephora TaxID=49390 RepID=A0A068VJ17_COFCA|nr:unnamed protein product [Coffea canephora]